ncbi:LysR substrate-binding domain-containing protein [Paracoccus ravus]|uniref:LysR substrate-binding domain-containing protein n=1 Tax=Paracoccus ravus TaxID=2447760 RepID=UPI00106EAF72|nr:LysR substrate-binding domain-containing protein [Paracoccus ravus]
MLERQHLVIIREVHRAGSVTAAAERMNLSQSAVSHAIAKLEERHQVKIWRKKGRSLYLTQAGTYLLSLAERMIPELEHAERVLADLARGRRGALRIGMECHPCEKWLMRVTGPYLADWRDVDLEVRSAFRFDGVAALQAHEIDMLVTPDPVHLPELQFRPVFDYELLLVVPADHPLADRSIAKPEDLLTEELLTVPVTPDRLDVFTRFLVPAGCRPQRHTGIESTDLMLQLVSAGRGVTVLPDWLVRNDGQDMAIATLHIGPAGLHKSINLGTRIEDAGIDYVSAFIDHAERACPL